MNAFWQQLAHDPIAALGGWFLLAPALVLLMSAAAVLVIRNLIHIALFATLAFVALGVVFIALGAEFVGFAQLLVYVGAVAMLMVFAILLTEPERLAGARTRASFAGPVAGSVIALTTLAALLAFIFSSPLAATPMPSGQHAAPVAAIGRELMGTYVVAFLALGVLLTAALVGAAIIAMEDKEP